MSTFRGIHTHLCADADPAWPAGSYTRLIALYSLVPFSAALLLALFAVLPALFWPSTPFAAHPPLLPHPLLELLLAAALWALAHLLRLPTYSALSALLPPAPASLLAIALHVVLTTLLRLIAVPLALPVPLPLLAPGATATAAQPPTWTWRAPEFHSVWALALGWAIADTVAGVAQGLEQRALYRDVLLPAPPGALDEDDAPTPKPGVPFVEPSPLRVRGASAGGGYGAGGGYDAEWAPPVALTELEVERDLEKLVALKERQELEEVYGMPVIVSGCYCSLRRMSSDDVLVQHIPVFIACLQRTAAILLSLGLTLLVGAAYLRSAISAPSSSPFPSLSALLAPSPLPTLRPSPPPTSNTPLFLALPLVALVHFLLATLHAPPLLAHAGVHTAAYVGAIVGLGALFAGLGAWGVVQ